MPKSTLLGVNVDHVATLRQARGTPYPCPVTAAHMAENAGADGITVHLREDRRHIQEDDVLRIQQTMSTKLNLEIAVTRDMLAFAEAVRPAHCCLVPEKREELTTEGGLDVVTNLSQIKAACDYLASYGIETSLFIDPDLKQIEAALACGAPVVELHTGDYAETPSSATLARVQDAAVLADSLGLIVNAGHGLHYENVKPIASISCINELNIGHSIVAESVFIGMSEAVSKMKSLILGVDKK